MGQSSPRLAGAMGGADLRSKLGGTIGFEASRAGPHNERTLTDCPTNYARPAGAVRITRQTDADRRAIDNIDRSSRHSAAHRAVPRCRRYCGCAGLAQRGRRAGDGACPGRAGKGGG
jgi:hypothetical protein